MKRKSGVFFFCLILIAVFSIADDSSYYRVLLSSNLENAYFRANRTSYSYRTMGISMDIDLGNQYLGKYRARIKVKKEIKKEMKELKPVLKKYTINITSSEKILYLSEKSYLSYPFKVGERIYIIKNTIKESNRPKLIYRILYYNEKDGFKEFKTLKFNYINSYKNNIIGVSIRRFPEFFILDNDFEIKKTLKHKGMIFPKDIIKKGDKIYFHKKRYKRGESAIEVMEKDKTNYYFNKTQSKSDELEEVSVMDDTVFSIGEKCFYITFTYPKNNFIYLYKYQENGRVNKIIIPIEDEYFGVPRYWSSLVRFMRRTIYDIASVNNIFEGKNHLYIATGRNRIKKMQDMNLRDYIYILSKDGKLYYGRVEIKYGTPVYHDKESGYFYSVKLKDYPEKEIWRWKIKIR